MSARTSSSQIVRKPRSVPIIRQPRSVDSVFAVSDEKLPDDQKVPMGPQIDFVSDLEPLSLEPMIPKSVPIIKQPRSVGSVFAIPELPDDQIVPMDPEIAFVPNEDLEPLFLEPMIPIFDKVTQSAPRRSAFEENFEPVCVANASVQIDRKYVQAQNTYFNRFIGVES